MPRAVKPKIIGARIMSAEVHYTQHYKTPFVNCKLSSGHFVTIASTETINALNTYYDMPIEPTWTLEHLAELLLKHPHTTYRFAIRYERHRDMIYTRVQLLPKEEQD